MVDDSDLRILTEIGRNPTGTVQEIAKATKMTSATVSNRIKHLKLTGALTAVVVQLHYQSLGLEPLMVFIEAPYKSLEAIEKLLDQHPYTRYRIRCLGYFNGIWSIFAVPQGSKPLLESFFKAISGRLVDRYRFIDIEGVWSYSENDFTGFDIGSGSWAFKWDEWESRFNTVDELPTLHDSRQNVLRRLDSKDMRILRQLTVDSRRPGKQIAAEANVTTYHLTRRMQLFEKLGVSDTHRVITMRVSNLNTTFIFDCQCNEAVTRRFSSLFRQLPFQTTLYPVNTGFLVQFTIPPEDLPIIGSILQKHCDNVRSLWSDYRNSWRYWFWDEPFNDGAWKSSQEFMVDDVLRKGGLQ